MIKYTLSLAIAITLCINCGAKQTTATTPSVVQSLDVGQCTVPAAIPDDGQDDRAAIQAVLDNSACTEVDLGDGVYNIATPPGHNGSGVRRPFYMLKVNGKTLKGNGQATVLTFTGDVSLINWHGIEILGASPAVTMLSMNTDGLTNGSEQTHAIQVTGPASGVNLASIWFSHHLPNSLTGGDCIKAVGYAASNTLIQGITVANNTFTACNRAGFESHSGVHNLSVHDNNFVGVDEIDIDSEGSGDNDAWEIYNNVFSLSNSVSVFAIAIDSVTNTSIHDNTINGKGVYFYSAVNANFSNNTINRTVAGDGSGVIQIEKSCNNITVFHNNLTRMSGVYPAPVINITDHNGGYPTNITLDTNTLNQNTEANTIGVTTVVGFTATSNILNISSVTKKFFGISITGIVVRSDQLAVTGNTFNGGLYVAAVRISGTSNGVGSLSTSTNTATGNTLGLRCEAQTNITGPLTRSGNNWGPDGALCSFSN